MSKKRSRVNYSERSSEVGGESSDEEMSNNQSSDRTRSRNARKSKHDDIYETHTNDEEDVEDDDADSERQPEKKRKKDEISDMDYGNTSSQQPSESENSVDSFDSTKKKRKKMGSTKVKPVIPGERKSNRARKGTAEMRELTDKEFEKMLEEEEEEKKKKKKRGKDKDGNRFHHRSRRPQTDGNNSEAGSTSNEPKVNRRLNRPPKKTDGDNDDDDDGSGNESDHLWYCELCKDGGDLLLCDTCPKSYHKECLKLEIVPDGEWSCPVCTGEGLPEKGDSSEEDLHDTFCRFCKDGGDVVLCDFCPLVYHMACLNPPMKNLPEGDWRCPICVIKMNPPKAKVKQVLTWRWKHQPKDADELDHTHSPQKQMSGTVVDGDGSAKKRPTRNEKELFVKYEYHSYWDCSWIAEIELEVHQPITHCNFKRKFDLNEPPALEDGSSFGRPRHKNASSEDDPHNLEERFYRYGIKPEWLQIHRIITHDGKNKDRRYLVKWRDLPYSDCTWEYPGELPKGLEGFEKYIDIYWDRRKQKLAKDDRKFEPPKKSLLRKKLEKQASYFDDCGGNLHPYQLEGLNWLRFSWSQGTNTILADEMGLGKTVQAIAFLYTLYKEGYVTNRPFLVSAPLSTVPNWEREFEFWAPELYVVTYTGVKENRVVLREQEFSYKEGAFVSTSKPSKLREGHKPKFDVLLTSYEFIHMDFTTLSSIEWGVLIIDEAHRLKNNQSLFFRTMADYKINYKLLLTGTPLQNNLEELFNLLHFLEPEKFANMDEFLSEFSEISKDEQVLKLHELLAPHMLRRMKMDVLKDIPSKSEFIVRIELSPMQKKYYKHILTKNYEALNAKGYSNQTSLINIMMDLRKCCNHPYLFPGAEKDAPLTMMGMYEGTTMTKASGKLEMLDKMLKRLKRDGHRVLIFSQMTRMLDIMEDFLTAFKYGYERIDGSISGNKRQESIDRFNSAESNNFVFLLSTRAGGLGINLATADTVIIYDMDWNPHNDIQAFSRAHRIGQKNKVMIYRFVTRNTVEEKIAQVCKQKMMLSELIVHRGMGGSLQTSEKTDSLTKQEISDILKYGAENLFRDDEEGQVVYSDEAIEKLLDRSIETVVEKEKEFGMNEYLRSFKVASYQVKEGVDDEEETYDNSADNANNNNNDDSSQQTTAADDRLDAETDMQYWQRVLGPAYNEHMIQTLKEQEELANKLGKGKRIRKHINYAEKEMMDAAEALSKVEARKRIVMEEDVTFQSDYEPSSTSDEEAGSGKEEDGSEGSKKKKSLMKGPPPPLPPLVDRIEGQVLVLGFTARQRRAFLDAVMRYGMPPEDPYRSQWLVRDLRGKTERNFKAYVSLFMRHLCEPISDNSDKFADGVPREGLSRQHVLTRIGIIALIRKKVHEFEHVNGVESMMEFKYKTSTTSMTSPPKTTTTTITTATSDSSTTTLITTTAVTTDATTTESTTTTATTTTAVLTTDDKKSINNNDNLLTNTDGSVDDNVNIANVGDVGKRHGDEKGRDGNEMMDVDPSSTDNKPPADNNDRNDDDDDDKVIGNNSNNDNNDDADADKLIGGERVNISEGKHGDVDGGESKATHVEGGVGDVKMDCSVDGGGDGSAKQIEDNQILASDATTTTTTTTDITAATTPTTTFDTMDATTTQSSTTTTTSSTPQQPTDPTTTTMSTQQQTTEPTVLTQTIDTNATTAPVSDTSAQSSLKGCANLPTVNEYVLLTSLKSASDISSDLRRRFWIADGGFTELHSLWELEEQQLVHKKEYETWHRRHDFWLLAGVITHGYRHWQDILSDPRFDILNQAFRSDSERARKAAFLNRRFQLLEQAMVIEEQLRKAVSENIMNVEQLVSINSTDPLQALQRLQMLDELAASLKNLNTEPTTKSGKTSKLQKVLSQITVLVSDINDMSYINMPASLAKPYTATIVRPQQQQQSLASNNNFNKVPGLASSWNQTSMKSPQQMGGIGTTKTSVYNHVVQAHQSNLARNTQQSSPSLQKVAKPPTSTTPTINTNNDDDKSKDVICID